MVEQRKQMRMDRQALPDVQLVRLTLRVRLLDSARFARRRTLLRVVVDDLDGDAATFALTIDEWGGRIGRPLGMGISPF